MNNCKQKKISTTLILIVIFSSLSWYLSPIMLDDKVFGTRGGSQLHFVLGQEF